jgi:anaerobic magnesium-protoporphyrin IX monomethyl ester cyclase
MTDILFTHSYYYRLDAKQWRFKQPYPPLGTLLVAAVVREQGFSVALHDAGLKKSPEEIRPALLRERPRFLVIYDDGFNYLTKMCLTVMREAAFVMANEAKKMNCTVIINSSDSADHYEKYFLHGVDYVIKGEGEETLKELLSCLDHKGDRSRIPGLAYKEGEKTVLTPPRSVMRDLDALPLPAWDLVDIDAYRKIWMAHHGYFSLNLATTRGCPFKCNWCAKPIYGNRYNTRSPGHVLREIELLLNNFQPSHFWMCDDIFGLKPGWVREFNALVKEKKLSFRYKIQSRVDLLLQEDTIDALAQSGAETVWVGAESGSQKILDAMDKGTTVEQIDQARGMLKKKGIKTAFFLQFGYLGETKEDIEATVKMVLKLMPEEIGISVSYPLPGTKFYETVKETLQEKKNWTDSDDLAMMFHGNYPPAFYKVLHRYVHGRYRIQRGIELAKKILEKRSWSKMSSLKTFASMVYHMPFTVLQSYQLKKFSPENATP